MQPGTMHVATATRNQCVVVSAHAFEVFDCLWLLPAYRMGPHLQVGQARTVIDLQEGECTSSSLSASLHPSPNSYFSVNLAVT